MLVEIWICRYVEPVACGYRFIVLRHRCPAA
jgi:hypothetical protein